MRSHRTAATIALIALSLLGALPAAAHRPKPAPTTTPAARQLSDIVVTAARHATPIQATSRHVWVIDAAQLDRVGALTAADALRFIPGTVVQQYGAFGSLATVALRGASTEQTLVLINGQPANEPDTGVFDFSSLPASAIDHIEVVEGGASTLYGSAALGGVINIFTKQPLSAGNFDVYAQLGYQGEYTRGLGVTGGAPDLLGRIDVQTVSGANVFAYPAYGTLYPSGVRTNDDLKDEDSQLSLSGHLGLVLANGAFQNDASAIGAPNTVLEPSGLAREQRVYQRMNLDFDLPLSRGDVELQLGSDGRRLHFYDPTQPFAYDTLGNANSRNAALRSSLKAGSSHTLTAGLDVGNDTALFDFHYEGVPYEGPPGSCQGIAASTPCVARDATSAWYFQDEYRPADSPLTLIAGIREQHAAGTKPVGVPEAGAVYALSRAVDVLLNYGRAFRTPNLDERYYPGYGNPGLAPEYASTFDAGLRARAHHSDFDVAYFGQDTNNLIINVPIDAFGDVKPFNVSRAAVRGITSSYSRDLGPFAHAAIAYTDFLRAVDETVHYMGDRLLYRPTSTASLTLWLAKGTWNYGIDSYFVGRRYADEANTQLMTPYVVTGIHMKKRISRRLAVTLRVENVGNNHNAEDELGYPVVGSAFSIRLSNR